MKNKMMSETKSPRRIKTWSATRSPIFGTRSGMTSGRRSGRQGGSYASGGSKHINDDDGRIEEVNR